MNKDKKLRDDLEIRGDKKLSVDKEQVYPKVVKLEDGTYTVMLENGEVKPWRFAWLNEFDKSSGWAKGMTLDGRLALVGKDGYISASRGVKSIGDFQDGVAKVTYDRLYIIINYYLGGEYIKTSFFNRYDYIDIDGNVWKKEIDARKYGPILSEIRKNPERFLTLNERYFKNKLFVVYAIANIKKSLTDQVKEKETVDKDFAEHCINFLRSVREKVKHPNKELADNEPVDKKASLLSSISEFEL